MAANRALRPPYAQALFGYVLPLDGLPPAPGPEISLYPCSRRPGSWLAAARDSLRTKTCSFKRGGALSKESTQVTRKEDRAGVMQAMEL